MLHNRILNNQLLYLDIFCGSYQTKEHIRLRLHRTIQNSGFAYLKTTAVSNIVDTENVNQLRPKCRILICHGMIISVVHENRLLSFSDMISEKTIDHALELFSKCGKEEYFGRMIVEEITGLKPSGASKLIKLLVESNVIVPVTGHGKGKYRFQL